MSLPVRLTACPVQDLAAAEQWYLDEAPHVLSSFEEEIDRAFRLISERPKLYQVVESTVRRNRSDITHQHVQRQRQIDPAAPNATARPP